MKKSVDVDYYFAEDILEGLTKFGVFYSDPVLFECMNKMKARVSDMLSLDDIHSDVVSAEVVLTFAD